MERRHLMVKPTITVQSQSTPTKPAEASKDAKPADVAKDISPKAEVPKPVDATKDAIPNADTAKTEESKPDADPSAPTVSKKRPKAERRPFTLVLDPSIWRKARLLSQLTGQSVSAMVEADLLVRIEKELRGLVEKSLGEE